MNIDQLLDEYLKLNPNEADSLKVLAQRLTQPKDITSRKNFVGHVTASAFIISQHNRQVLLLRHKALSRLLQPGGHLDPGDLSPLQGALREVKEETGLKAHELTPKPLVPKDKDVPFDINIHEIPENIEKGEPSHYHYDFRYMFTTSASNIEIDSDESNGYKWVSWEDFIETPDFAGIADKISSLLEAGVQNFFRAVSGGKNKQISVIAVSHLIPSSEDYIESLRENFNLIGIIPKPKSINTDTLKRLNENGTIILEHLSRERIRKNPSELIELLESHEKICLIDIGGYFTSAINQLEERLGNKLLGIIEDTENGRQKYEKLPTKKSVTIASVARSPLKNYEDELVGQGVAHATETILRQINTLITYKSCGIIGYGKVGRGIADYLRQRGIRPRVCEVNALRSVQASCDGAIICSLDDLIGNSDVIFCATGSRALDIIKLRNLRNGTYIASATSSDDEFDLTSVSDEYQKFASGHSITHYAKRGHSFNLINDGNAVNFLFAAAVDKYISLVQGEIIYSICKLEKNIGKFLGKNILTNNLGEQEQLAQLWLDYVMPPETSSQDSL